MIERVVGVAAELRLGLRGLMVSPLRGPAGNVEFFLWLRRDAGAPREEDVLRAVREGPQGRVRTDVVNGQPPGQGTVEGQPTGLDEESP